MTQLSRGHLLRVLSTADNLDSQRLAALLGFEARADANADSSGNLQEHIATVNDQHSMPVLHTVQKDVRFWYVGSCLPVEDDASSTKESVLLENESDDSQKGHHPTQPFMESPLFGRGEWQNFWDQVVLTQHMLSRFIDVPRNVKRLAAGKPVTTLLKKTRRHWSHSTVFIVDRCHALRPLWSAMRDAWLSLQALLSDDQLVSFYLPTGPLGTWYQMNERGAGREHDIPDRAQVIMLGAFGALESSEVDCSWQHLIQRLRDRGHSVVLLSACFIRHMSVPVLPLETRPPKQWQTLLSALSQVWRPSIAQLRALRRAIPGAGLVDELLVYNHVDVSTAGMSFELKQEALLPHLQAYDEVDDNTKALVRSVAQSWQNSLGPTIQDIETLQRTLHLQPSLKNYPRLQRLAAKVARYLEGDEQEGLAHGLLLSMLPITHQLEQADWHAFLTVAQRVALRANQALPMQHKELPDSGGSTWLTQINQSLHWTDNPGNSLLRLGPSPYCVQRRQLLAHETRSEPLDIIDRQWHWQLKTMGKPAWAERLWSDNGVLYAAHEGGAVFQLHPASPQQPQAQWQCINNPWRWTSLIGVDDLGLWADLSVDSTTYRLRWIHPGTFTMGSPEDEKDGEKDEIQHKVTLTQGFWIGEISCTQALWKAVMGENPSSPEGDNLPVESVSWNDCQIFLESLQQRVPDLRLTLPTEAQWEYACRAGTQSRYWWGDDFDERYGNNGYSTKPEASYPPNAFGLKSVHGNVGEWCANWYGGYPNEAVTDPCGPSEGTGRVLRGGGWFFDGRSLRSAYRLADSPDFRYALIGLRLAGGLDPQASAGAATAARWTRSGQTSSGSSAGEQARLPREE